MSCRSCKKILNTKVPFPLVVLIILIAATITEQIYLEVIKANQQAYDAIAAISLAPSQDSQKLLLSAKDEVALSGADVPLIPGSKRLTFSGGDSVTYRVNVPATEVAYFYQTLLAHQGWKASVKASTQYKPEKLTITYSENPISKKTDVTYAFAPAGQRVLGVKIAESTAPATDTSSSSGQPQPQTEQVQPINQTQPTDQTSGQQPNYQQPVYQQQPDGQQQYQNGQPSSEMNFYKQPEGQNFQMGPQGDQNQGKQGPSEEEQKKMDERRFKDMKRGISQFTKGVIMTKKGFGRVKVQAAKCGVGVPEDLSNALSQADELIAKINSAQTADELDEVMENVQDIGSVIQEWGPRMGDLSRLCQMFKQADRDIKQFERNLKRTVSQANANKKIDLSELVTQYQAAVAAQKDTLAQAKELAKTDPETAMSKIEDDFYGNMDNLGNMDMQINAVLNITRGMKNIAGELKGYASQIKKLDKKKIDTAELKSLLDGLTSQAAELKALVAGKASADDLIAKVEEAFDTRQQLQDSLQELGVSNQMPQIKGGENYNVKVNIPDAFRKEDNGEND